MIGNKVCFFQTLESTNTFMKEHISDFKHGDMVCAKIQTAGRGRRSRSWVSTEGNLHTSFVLEQVDRTYTNFEVVMKSSVAIVKLLTTLGIPAKIKYPNDIVVEHRKIAGILIEKVADVFIVGIGINVSFNKADMYDFHPGSILLETGKVIDYRDVLSLFIDTYNSYQELTIEELYRLYKDYTIVIGQEVDYQEEHYQIKDVLITGELVLVNNVHEVTVVLNEISLDGFYREQ